MASKEIRRNGYVYGPKTKAGFLRLQRQGVPQPPFRLEDKLRRSLSAIYQEAAAAIFQDFMNEAKACRVLTTDGLSEFEAIKAFTKAFPESKGQLITRGEILATMKNLEEKWTQAPQSIDNPVLRDIFEKSFKRAQEDFFIKFMKDADGDLIGRLQSFTIDQRELFDQHIDELRKLYLDNSMERAAWEQDALKRRFLKLLNAYVNGETDALNLEAWADEVEMAGDGMARIFARDQMARFNKAVMITTYNAGHVSRVKWVTCRDARVRKSHEELDGQIFDINNLPPELNDYNCRCGLVPVEYTD